MRTLTGLMVALTLGLASGATATSITVDTDKKTYSTGQTITVTTTLVIMAVIDGLDFAIFLPAFIAGSSPGPSGLPCAGTVPCHP